MRLCGGLLSYFLFFSTNSSKHSLNNRAYNFHSYFLLLAITATKIVYPFFLALSTFSTKRHKIAHNFHIKTVAFDLQMLYNNKAARRWGGSGTLHPKSAISGLNAFLDICYGRLRTVRGVDNKVLCNVIP